MTPKEKAEDLFKKMFCSSRSIKVEQSKKCALIAIDEMLDFRNNLYMNKGSLAHQYLIEVKKEIEKI